MCVSFLKGCFENRLPLRSIYVSMPSELIKTSNIEGYGLFFSSGCIYCQDLFSLELVKIEGR